MEMGPSPAKYCRLYIDEGKTLDEVMEVMKEVGFTPKAR